MSKSTTRRWRAFSIIELLVVIGVIAILMGLLCPAVIKARRQASAVQCKSQMHHLGIAIAAYATANRGAAVPVDRINGWTYAIFKNRRPKVVVCPTSDSNLMPSYQLNYWLTISRRTLGDQSRVPSSHVVLAGESPPNVEYEYSIPMVSLPPGVTSWDPLRHGPTLKSNYLWLDYHVSNEAPIPRPGALDDWYVTNY